MNAHRIDTNSEPEAHTHDVIGTDETGAVVVEQCSSYDEALRVQTSLQRRFHALFVVVGR